MPKEKEVKGKEKETPEVVDNAEVTNVEETETTETISEVAETIVEPAAEETQEPLTEEEPTVATEGAAETIVDSEGPITVQPVKFASFEEVARVQGEPNKNLEILMDIKLQLTVELGRTELPIKKVLELTRGSIIELEKIAGEPVELYANGKLVAHGEVVVIEDNFGLRITSITEPDERLKGIQN